MKIFSTIGCTSTIYWDENPDFLLKYTTAPTWLSFLISIGKVEGEYLGTFPATLLHFDTDLPVHGFRVKKYKVVNPTDLQKPVWKTLENIALEVFDIFNEIAPKNLVASSDYWLANFLWDNDWTLIPYDSFEIYEDESCKTLSQFLF